MAGRMGDEVVLSDEEREFLEARMRRRKAARSLSDRRRMMLLCAEGLPSREVAALPGVHEHTVGKWRRRLVKDRIEGLTDEYRPGRPRTVSDSQVAEVIERTLNATPKDAAHRSIRSTASATGLSHRTIRRIWNASGLQPHRSETFEPSPDPLFVDKAQDIVGAPSVATRSGYGSVSRREIPDTGAGPRTTRLAHGARRGRATSPHIHPPRRNVAGRGAGHRDRGGDREMLETAPRRRVPGFSEADRPADAQRSGRASRDGQSRPPQDPQNQAMAGAPPALVRFTPTSASWINQVERWFAELTRKQLQRGAHRSTAELEADIVASIEARNETPKPYKWVKSAAETLAAVNRFRQRTLTAQCAEL